MDIVSDPYRTETHREWDFLLTGGYIKNITLKVSDSVSETNTCWVFKTVSPKEVIVVYRVHTMGYSYRERQVVYPIKGKPTEIPTRTAETSPPQAPTSPSGPAD